MDYVIKEEQRREGGAETRRRSRDEKKARQRRCSTCHLRRPPEHLPPTSLFWETHLIPLSLRLDCPSSTHLSSYPRLSVSWAPTVSFGADPPHNLSISGPL